MARVFAFVLKSIEGTKKNLEKINQDTDLYNKVKGKIKN